MKKSGAWLVRYALEQLGIQHTFGIPGVHNTEIYDELASSEHITPVLVTHEACAGFMADAISRTSNSVGTLLIVPAAGVAYAAAAIGEAYLDGIPLLVITGGIRRDSNRAYQLHDIDQHALLKPITKQSWLVESQADIVPTLFDAYRCATTGEPGPVLVEIPVELQLFVAEVGEPPKFTPADPAPQADADSMAKAIDALLAAKNPGLFLGWGARGARKDSQRIAELLGAPVATTLQGLDVFPGNHPLHTGMGFGGAAVPAARNAFAKCDCLLAVGTRFGEIATGSYSVTVPENLIHIDINPAVFSANYPAKVTIEADARQAMSQLADALEARLEKPREGVDTSEQIAKDKAAYVDTWLAHDSGKRVNPAVFFRALRQLLDDNSIVVADDGNHTFLTAELMAIHNGDQFISPTDFNCMGYCVPAVIGAKLVNPQKQVVGIVGDGAFLMTGLETITAVSRNLGCVFFVFNDGELSQISQAQEIPFNRKTCSTLGELQYAGIAQAVGAEYLLLGENAQAETVILQALTHAGNNRPVIVDVHIDYSKRTAFTDGAVKANLERFPLSAKVRMVGRALWRRIKVPGAGDS